MDLKKEIVRFLAERPEKAYTSTQVTAHLELKKDYRTEIQSLLNQLFSEGFINKNAKRYSISPERIVPEAVEDDFRKQNEVVTGRFDATSMAKNFSYAFVICEEGKDVFVSTEDTLNAYHGDTVEVEIVRYRNEKRYGIIRKVLKRNKDKFVGVIERIKKKIYFRCDNLKIHTSFEVLDDKKAKENHKVMVEVINWGLRQKNKLPICNVTEILGEAGNPEVEILSVIREFDLPLEFPDEVIEEANQFSPDLDPSEIQRRTDLRQLYTITIDPVSAKDFDDAISLSETENGDFHLFVHIADVAHYIKQDSHLFAEAVNRGNSYYFPKKVIPMLPEILSNKLCSLRPDEDKFTLTVLTVFDKSGKIKSQQVSETVIRSNIRLAYEEVDEYFENINSTDFADELRNTLSTMRKLSKHLSLGRRQRGYLKFDLPEVEYIYDDEGYIQDIIRTKETESHVLIENFMLIANEFVAKLLTQKAKTTIYRIHEEPDERDLTKIQDILKVHSIHFTREENLNKTWQAVLDALPNERYHRVFDRLILRSMKKAKYSINPIMHFGLGLETYTHFTSPIRRLCDLLVHMQLKHHIFKQSKSLDPATIFEYAGIATERESIADESERSMESKVLSSFMKKNIGKQYQAIINNMNNNSIFVELDDIPVRGVIKLNQLNDDYYEFDDKHYLIKGKRKGKIYRLCDSIQVIVASVTDEVVFELAEQRKNKPKLKEKKKFKRKR